MQIIRTVVWVLIASALVAFIAMNWGKAPVNFWPLANGNFLHFDWPVGIIALIFFVLGLTPMWLLHKAGRWRLTRRIASLENTVRATSTTAAPPIATTTQLEAEAQEGQSG